MNLIYDALEDYELWGYEGLFTTSVLLAEIVLERALYDRLEEGEKLRYVVWVSSLEETM